MNELYAVWTAESVTGTSGGNENGDGNDGIILAAGAAAVIGIAAAFLAIRKIGLS